MGLLSATGAKQLTIYGTKHWTDATISPKLREALKYVIEKIQPDVTLEEWSETQKDPSAAHAVSSELGIKWESIGTKQEPRLTTCGFTDALDYPWGNAHIAQFGPLDVQNERENIMCENIRKAMESRNAAVVVIGLAHMSSMLMKLRVDFEAAGYSYLEEDF